MAGAISDSIFLEVHPYDVCVVYISKLILSKLEKFVESQISVEHNGHITSCNSSFSSTHSYHLQCVESAFYEKFLAPDRLCTKTCCVARCAKSQ